MSARGFEIFSFPFFVKHLKLVRVIDPLISESLERLGKGPCVTYPDLRYPTAEVVLEALSDISSRVFLPEVFKVFYDEKLSRRAFIRSGEDVKIKVVSPKGEGQDYHRLVFPMVVLLGDSLELIMTAVDVVSGSLDVPVYHYSHPFLEQYTKPMLWSEFSEKQIKENLITPPTPWPLWERFRDKYMCRGVFFPTYRLRSLAFKGIGAVGDISLMNYTSEPVTFEWVVPPSWESKIYWIKDERKTHSVVVGPGTHLRQFEVGAYIDPSVKECDGFLPTLVVAKSRSRVEWLPVPLFPEREADLFLDDSEISPKI